MEVGIRELRNGLSRFLKHVQRGERIVVTEHGRPVAQIIPAGVPEPIAKLMADGRVTWSGKPFSAPRRPIKPRPDVPFSQYISEDRS